MGIEAEFSRRVYADPDTIWEQLGDPTTWPNWWMDCVAARTLDNLSLREGSRLEVLVKPRLLQMTFNPVVDLYTERRTLSLTHRSALVHTTLSWQLVEKGEYVQVTATLVFNGLLPFLITITQQSGTVRTCINTAIKGLKRVAEQRF
jgi:hypothetical protein